MAEGRRQLASLSVGLVGFLAVIALGAFLLSMPCMNRSGSWLPFTDAAFMACTSVCVTGLVTVVPVQTFTLPGQIIILVLIQIGGWGVIVCGSSVLMLLKKRISIANRTLLRDYFGMDTLKGIVKMLIYVVTRSLMVEGIGALLCMPVFIRNFGPRGIWCALFHSVSAFCNAGIDLLGADSLAAFALDPWINFVTMALIIMGGLGFIVWIELKDFFVRWFKGPEEEKDVNEISFSPGHGKLSRKEMHRQAVRRLSVHAKLVVMMTVVLIVLGWILIFITEHDNPATLGAFGVPGALQASLFQSVTTRTAGFAAISQGGLRDATKFICCIFMLIGGSPVGTAGGIKTVTVAVLFVSVWSVLKGREDTECFGRRIEGKTVRTAQAVVALVLFMVIAGTVLVSLLEPQLALIDVMYEISSAVATVGLSTGITAGLSVASKWVIIVLMYCGRVGPISLPMVAALMLGKKGSKRRLASEHIVVG